MIDILRFEKIKMVGVMLVGSEKMMKIMMMMMMMMMMAVSC